MFCFKELRAKFSADDGSRISMDQLSFVELSYMKSNVGNKYLHRTTSLPCLQAHHLQLMQLICSAQLWLSKRAVDGEVRGRGIRGFTTQTLRNRVMKTVNKVTTPVHHCQASDATTMAEPDLPLLDNMRVWLLDRIHYSSGTAVRGTSATAPLLYA